MFIDKPLNCFLCMYMKRDLRMLVDRRFYCGAILEEKRRVITIYDMNHIPRGCLKYE